MQVDRKAQVANAREEQQMSNENETQTSAEVTSPISDEMADAALDVVMDDGHNGLDCRPARNLGETVLAALEAAFPAIRQQIAEEIAVAGEAIANGHQKSAEEHRAIAIEKGTETRQGQRHMRTAHSFRDQAAGAWEVAHAAREHAAR